MIKRILSTMMLLTSLLGGSISKALAAFPKALWFADTQTLYFVYDDVSYGTGGDRVTSYKGKTISDYWDGTQFNNRIYTSDNTIMSNCKYVVIEDNFSSAGMTSCWGMFMNLAALESITGLANMITSSVTSMSNMFKGCTNLVSINFDGVNTSNATDMQSIFSGCKTLSSLDLTNFDTRKVTVMDNMFKDCENLTSLTLGSNFKTDQITNMSYMFYRCKKLASLDVTSFNTAAVTNMSNLFYYCEALTTLDLSHFDVSKVTDMSYMFFFNKELVTIYCNDDWNTKTPTSADMFHECRKLEGAIKYDGSKVTAAYANPNNGYFTNRAAVLMSFSTSDPYWDNTSTATVGMDFTEPTLSTNPVEGVSGITYSSSDPTVATVIGTTGEVTPLSTGSTTITASYPGNGSTLLPNSASYTLNVTAIKYNAYIGGVQLTTDHINVPGRLAENLGSNLTGGTVSLTAETDYSSPKLTLNGATITNTGTSPLSVSTGGTLALELEGNNQITSTVVPLQNHGSLTISGTGTLTLSGASHGITNDGSITLNGGTLDVTGTTIGYDGIDASSNLAINGGVLMATGSNASLKSIGDITLGSGVAFTQPLGAKWDKSASQYVTDASGHTITSQVTIAKGAVAAELAYSASTGTATCGETPSLPTLTNPYSLPITYSSSNTTVATVGNDGKVTVLSPGTTIITASFDGSATYLAASVSYTLTVNEAITEVVMSFTSSTPLTATVGMDFTEPTLSTDPEVTVTYSSSNPLVATVNETTGKVTPLTSGSTTITASYAGNGTLLPNSAFYTLTVNAKEFNASIGSVILTTDHIKVPGRLTEDLGSNLTGGTVSLTCETDYSCPKLTLNGATITNTGTSSLSVSSGGTLALVLEGDNQITSTVVPLQNHGTLNISGTGKLTLSGAAHGIENDGSITLNEGTLDVTGTQLGYYGNNASSNLTISDGVLMATGGTASIRAKGSMVLGEGVAITQPLGAQKGTGEIWDVVDASGHTITSKVTIAKGAVAAGLAYSATEGTATYGVAPTGLPTLTNTHSLPITYSSSNTTVATINSEGAVTILHPGTTIITASFDGSATYLAASASYTLTVNKGTPVLTFSATEATATYGTTPNVLSLTVQPEELLSSINYISTIEDKATVGTDKKIQIKKKGLTYIKAIFNASEYYNAADAQYALTINPATATLQFGNDEVNCKVGETISSQTAQTSPGGLTVTYSSNLPSVAGVDETTGKVTASQAGTATITGTVNTDQYYGTKSYQVTITKNANDLAFEKTEVSAAYGDVFTPPTLINPHELGVNYSSSDHSVALVDPISGVVTFKTTGEVDITADFVGNGKYEAGSATYHLTITKKNAALAFAQPTATATYSAAFTEPALTNPNSLTVTYESSEPTVATVATDGKVTVLKAGETTISAKFTGNTLYNASTVSYVLTVNPKIVSSPTITLSATSFTYDGTAKQPTVTVKDGSTTIPASEYTVGYSNNTNVGTATVTITDKAGGNYTVSGSTTFAIAAADGSLTPPVGKTGLVFSGTAQNLITAGSSTTGTVQYSLDGTTYGTAIPQGTDAKEYTIYYKVVAKAGYKDVAPASFKVAIAAKSVSSPTITLSATSFAYDGTAKQPTVTVKDGSTTIPASEYTVGYSNNTNVGTATVTITDKAGGNYTVSGTTTFAIAAADGSLTPPVGKTGLVFSGTAQNLITAGSSTTGTVQYSLDGTTYGTAIPQGTDAKEYTIYYKVVAKAGYKDVAPASFKVAIAAKSVSSPTITLSATSFAYDGTAKQPTVTVKDGSTTIPASEYTVGYSNNTNVGTATVTITDKAGGNYTVSGTTTFAIAAADGSLTPPVGKTGLVFSGTAQNLITAGSSTTGTVQYSLDGTTYGTAIPQGTDAKEYTIYYKVVAKAGYKDVAPASFKVTIAAKSVSSPTITLSATSFAYDGTAKQPTVTVKDGSTTIPASEYTVGYSNNTNVGTATVTITDKAGGNYTVSGTTTFVIVLRGDANGDNKVDVSDIVEMVNAKAGRASAKFKMANADIDNNGTITETDINAVTRIIMGE